MTEVKEQSQSKDFKDRFEFKLTMKNKTDGSENIICQRYFRINNFNPLSPRSYELADTLRECAEMIDRDLKSKTQVYLEMFAPMYFDTVEQMTDYFKSPINRSRMHLGEGIIVKENEEHSYFWNGEKAVESTFKFNDGDLSALIEDTDMVEYKLAFYDYGWEFLTNKTPKELCSTVWTGVYPKYIRNSIDLSNKRGRFVGDDVSKLSFEQYMLYKIVEGRSDLVYLIIKNICATCSCQDDDWFTTSEIYRRKDGMVTYYDNAQWRTKATEVK